VKQAMINIEEYLRAEKLKTRLLVQIHDELLFEVAEEELSFVKVSSSY
jgi:DNA polymerase-1